VLTFEDFRSSGEVFIKKILEFAGVDSASDLPFATKVNRGGSRNSATVTALKRRLNRLTDGNVTSINPHAVRLRAARPLFANLHRLDSVIPNSLSTWIEQKWKRQIHDCAKDRYISSNRALSEMTGLDLASLGYDA
ncbi:MAG: hypothetical protein ACRD1T_24865, partial [Acidimicrobiia bacterium]